MKKLKTGLVMEGGSMRGMFTCGVIDVLMENGLWTDGAIGVSAGAAFGCNYKSRQIGRPIRYNKAYCRDPRYASMRNLLLTGDLFGVKFCYDTLPFQLDLWDEKAFNENPMEFYVVCTDVMTGKAVYHKLDDARRDISWIRASASIPMLSRVVSIGDLRLLDGGVADSIPLAYFESIGYQKNIVIETRPDDYVMRPGRQAKYSRILLRRYPNMFKALGDRYLRYAAEQEYVRQRVKAGSALAIRPKADLGISGTVKDPDELERVYQLGREAAAERLDEIRSFLA